MPPSRSEAGHRSDEAPTLAAEPDWEGAARALVEALPRAGGAEARVWLLYQIAGDLGAPLYPALIRVLCAVERYGDAGARRLVCDTLAYAARSWRAPPGRLAPFAGSADEAGFEAGPLEYLVIWRWQQEAVGPLSRARYAAALRFLLGLMTATPEGRAAQAEHLRGVAARALPGQLAAATTEEIERLAGDLAAGVPAPQAAERAAARSERVGIA